MAHDDGTDPRRRPRRRQVIDDDTALELLAAVAIGRYLTFGSCQVYGLEDTGLDVNDFRRAVRSVARRSGVKVRTISAPAFVLVHNDDREQWSELATLVTEIVEPIVVRSAWSGGVVLDPNLMHVLDARTAFVEKSAAEDPFRHLRHLRHLQPVPDEPS